MHSELKARKDAQRRKSKQIRQESKKRRRNTKRSKQWLKNYRNRILYFNNNFTILVKAKLRKPKKIWKNNVFFE